MVARKGTWVLAAGLALWGVSLAAADSVDDVIKKILEKAGATTSAQMKGTYSQTMDSASMKMSTKGIVSVVFVKKGEKLMYRMEGETHSTTTVDGKDTKMDMKMQSVSDGEFVWTYTENGTDKSAMKTRPTHQAFMPEQDTFDQLRQMYDLKTLPDAKVGEHACWVIEATAKNAMEGMPKTVTHYFCQETGCELKVENKDADGKVTGTILVTDLKTPVDPPADTFKFKAPEGVEVKDMTSAPGGTSTPPPSGTASGDDKPASPPPSDKPASPPPSDKPAPAPAPAPTPKPTTPSVPKLPGAH